MFKLNQILRYLIPQNIKQQINSIKYMQYVNTPVKFSGNDYVVNERIVELPLVHQLIGSENINKLSILELGCARSLLSQKLSSLGATVTGIDLRPYPFTHPNFTFHQKNILDLDQDNTYDYLISISTIEHIGLGAYNEPIDETHINKVMKKISDLVRIDGKVIFTVPFGLETQDDFMRSFTINQINSLFPTETMKLIKQNYYKRKNYKHWVPCSLVEASQVDNSLNKRGESGVNGVGCFVWKKLS